MYITLKSIDTFILLEIHPAYQAYFLQNGSINLTVLATTKAYK